MMESTQDCAASRCMQCCNDWVDWHADLFSLIQEVLYDIIICHMLDQLNTYSTLDTECELR